MLVWSSKIVVLAPRFGGIYEKCFFVNWLPSEGTKPSVGELTSTYDINTCEHHKIVGLVGCRRARAREQLKYLCAKISVFLENRKKIKVEKRFLVVS
jgi:hypothetical protein